MSVLDRVTSLEKSVELLEKDVEVNKERISGEGGLTNAMKTLTEEVKSMKRAMWTVGGGVVLASIGFGFSVLQLVG